MLRLLDSNAIELDGGVVPQHCSGLRFPVPCRCQFERFLQMSGDSRGDIDGLPCSEGHP